MRVGGRGLGDGDAVEGAVELAVAAAVEAVALVFARAGVEWCNAGVAGELSVGGEAVDRADLAEQLAALKGPQPGSSSRPTLASRQRADIRESSQPPPTRVSAPQQTTPTDDDSEFGNVP